MEYFRTFRCKKYYNENNRTNFVRILFQREFAGTDIATIKNFRIDPSKTLIPIYEAENSCLNFHCPEDYVRKKDN